MQPSNQMVTPPGISHYVPDQNKTNAFYSSYRMSQSSAQCQPMISDCYKELKMDPSLLQSFSEDNWMSVDGLPSLCAIHFCIVSERFFTKLTSSNLWGKSGADVIIKVGRRPMNIEITPLAILIMHGVGQGKAGNDNCLLQNLSSEGGTFGCTFELSPVGLTQARCSSSEGPSLSQPIFCLGSFGSLYLYITILSAGALTTQFPLAQLHLHRLLPYSPTQIVLP